MLSSTLSRYAVRALPLGYRPVASVTDVYANYTCILSDAVRSEENEYKKVNVLLLNMLQL